MNTIKNVFLIGPMGSGKTAVGRQLARLLGLRFYDSDAELELTTGVDIPYIFEKEGETGFRERECETIDTLTRLSGVVLATGGGVVLSPVNRDHLRSRGHVVYLQTSVEQQIARTKQGRQRPLLQTADPEAKLRELFAARVALYESIAAIIVNTDHRKVSAVAAEIVRLLSATFPGSVDVTRTAED